MATFVLTGNENINRIGAASADSIVGSDGNNGIATGDLNDTIVANGGSDAILDIGGNNTIQGGSGADSIRVTDGIGTIQGNDGADTIDASGAFGYTVAGGNDSSDAADSIVGSSFGDFLLGNGGADTLVGGGGRETLVGGFATDSITGSALQDFIWGNENNDSINAGTGENSVWAGLGNDIVVGTGFIFGNEGADTMAAIGAATLWGGTLGDGSPDGNDFLTANGQSGVVLLGQQGNDTLLSAGNTTMTGGSDTGDVFNVQGAGFGSARITDLNWANDQLDVFAGLSIQVVGNVGPTDDGGQGLAGASANAIAQVSGGNLGLRAAAQFVFAGRTFVAVDQFGNDFTAETLIDITGVTGTIDTGNFIT